LMPTTVKSVYTLRNTRTAPDTLREAVPFNE